MSLKSFREKFGGAGVSDDDRLLRYFAGDEAVAAMRAAGPPKEYARSSASLLTLIEEISKRKDSAQVYVKRNGLSLRLERRRAAH
jgi:hypothetical protein